MTAFLEHVNVTVSDPEASAAMLRALFGWRVRWKGASVHGGATWHVGNDTSYIALYTMGGGKAVAPDASYGLTGGLNHIAVVVDDLDSTEARVRALGLEPHSHADYEPGRRFYFDDRDGIEYEVVDYR